MSAILQSGQHPDADQLTAFVEHSLPLHEQQATLAHLATCADCRAIVYIAETVSIDQSPQPKPVAAHKPWLSSWNLAWTAAAALACLILVTIALRNINSRRPVTTARLQPASPPLVSGPPAASTHEPQPQSAPPPSSATPSLAVKSPLAASQHATQPAPALGRPAQNKSYSQVPLPANAGQRNAAAFQSSMPSAQPSPSSNASTGSSASNGNAGIYGGAGRINLNENYLPGVPASSAATAGNALPPQQRVASAAAQPASNPSAARALHSLSQQYYAASSAPRAAPPPAQTDALAAQSEDNAAATVVAGAEIDGFAERRLAKITNQPALPSHLPVRSTASNTHQQLAIDTSGELFRSEDAGVTWQPVPAQWTGQAVRVSLTPSPNPQSPNPQTAGQKISPQSAAASTAASAAAIPAPPAAFELTTDTGQHWISTDGLAWKRN